MAYRPNTYLTLSEEKIQFIRDNVNTMTQKQMALHFGCSQSKVCENARIEGIEFPTRNANKPKRLKDSQFFDVSDFKSWF